MIENGGEQIFTDHMLSTSRCALHLPLNERLTAAGRAFPAGNAANWRRGESGVCSAGWVCSCLGHAR